MLFVRVKSKDGGKVKVNVPLDLIKIVGGIGSMYGSEFEKYNIDMDKLMDAIDNGFVGRIVEVAYELNKMTFVFTTATIYTKG